MPPVTQTSATPWLASHIDLALLVLEPEKPASSAAQASALMREARANVAAVLNKHRFHMPAALLPGRVTRPACRRVVRLTNRFAVSSIPVGLEQPRQLSVHETHISPLVVRTPCELTGTKSARHETPYVSSLESPARLLL